MYNNFKEVRASNHSECIDCEIIIKKGDICYINEFTRRIFCKACKKEIERPIEDNVKNEIPPGKLPF